MFNNIVNYAYLNSLIIFYFFAKCKSFLMLINNLFHLFVASHKNSLAFSTLQTYASCYRKLNVIGNMHVNEINTMQLQTILNEQKNLSTKTINNLISFTQSLFKFAVNMQLIKESPAAGLVRCKPNKKQIECLTAENSIKLINYLIKQEKLIGYFYAIAFNTGLRTSELYALRWQDINVAQKKITIEAAIVRGMRKCTKTNHIRYIDVNDACIKYLLSLYAISSKHTYIFSNDNYSFNCNNAKRRNAMWYKALKILNIPKIKPSATRHTYASIALSEGARPAWVAQQLGHASINTTYKFYAKWINCSENSKFANLINL
jgi:integrase